MGKKTFSGLFIAGLVTVGAIELSQNLPTVTSAQHVLISCPFVFQITQNE